MVSQTVILDACVLYPAPLRDLLLSVAANDLYRAHWTQEIHNEWTRNLLLNRPDLSADQLKRTVEMMNQAFPDSLVEDYEKLIDSVVLPDPQDRHILAAAIKCQANVIVTNNIRDFPREI